MIIPKFELFSPSSGVCPERFNDLSCDPFRGRNFLCSRAPEDLSRNPISDWGSETDVPIIAAWRRRLEIKVPRCAPNPYE
jgi:hypothetical protein